MREAALAGGLFFASRNAHARSTSAHIAVDQLGADRGRLITKLAATSAVSAVVARRPLDAAGPKPIGALPLSDARPASSFPSARVRSLVAPTAGALAFSRMDDPNVAELTDAVVLFKAGEIPDDAEAR